MHKIWKPAVIVLLVLAVGAGLVFYAKNSRSGKQTLKNPLYQNSAGDKSLRDYYQQGQQLANSGVPASTTVTFLAVGDIMLSRNVAQGIADAKDANLPFSHMAEIFNPPAGSEAFNFGNLESPAVPTGTTPIVGGHSLVFGAPQENLAALKKNNFKILNLANNHAFDQGLAGIDATRSVLDSLGAGHTGTGDNLGQAWEPAVIDAGGLKVCFIGASYSSVNDSGKARNNYVARIQDVDYLKSAVQVAKGECDFTVATMHAGTEYTREANAGQTAFAHAAIDDGADLVIGGHPHWIQTVEKYRGKYIFYSLGNFVFDQNFSEDTKEGLTLKIRISKLKTQNPTTPGAVASDDLQGSSIPAKLEEIDLIPVIIENSQPRPATAEEAKKILNKIGQADSLLKP